MANLLKYGTYDPSLARKEREEITGGEFVKLEGKKKLRFLPPPVGRKSPFVIIHLHYLDLPGADRRVTFNCPQMMLREPCPACETAERLRSSGNPVDYNTAKGFFPSTRIHANVIDRANPEKGPQPVSFPKSVYRDLSRLLDDEDFGPFYSPWGEENCPQGDLPGYDITIDREGTGPTDTRYSVRAAQKSTPLAKTIDQMQEWIDTQPDLNKYLNTPSYQQICERVKDAAAQAKVKMPLMLQPTPKKSTSRNAAADLEDDDNAGEF